jgi:type IV pilus assembly protein PilY1
MNKSRLFVPLLTLAFALMVVPYASGQAVISTTGGTVSLGVDVYGALGAGSLPGGSNVPGQMYGIYYAPNMWDAIAPGCYCEGWGAAVNGTDYGQMGNANGGLVNLNSVSFASTANTATSVTTIGSTGLQVTQAYAPSVKPAASEVLFVNTVTLTNTSSSTLTNVLYSRAMDWDIPPTEFNEYVTIGGLPASKVLFSNDNGFCAPNPLGSCGQLWPGTTNVNFTKAGPTDQGSFFTFAFGDLAAGASTTFSIVYGVGANESTTLAALAAEGVGVYTLGYASNGPGGSANVNSPVWAFGFEGVGGSGVTPEPGTILMLGTGLLGLGGMLRRKLRM